MRYISTRGQAQPLDFEQAMLTGLARDGGLYVPESWPQITPDELRSLRGKPYVEIAYRVMQPFVGDAIDAGALRTIIEGAYARFDHPSVAPLVKISPNEWLLELWHGPTLAFKDVAMQVLGRLYDHVLDNRGRRVTLIGATSGDTGSAAIEAVRGRAHASIFVMHPHGRTSDVQRRQMTTVDAPNVHNIAIEGTFDDCQSLLKAMFNDHAFRDQVSMSAVNSINWARILPQIVYYFTAALELGAPERQVSFSVPTGNFGDIYAGYVAQRMGLPVERLIIASNVNDILTRAINTGEHALSNVQQTMSPSMDIQVSSNFERLLFDVYDRDAAGIRDLMKQLADKRRFDVPKDRLDRIRQLFGAHRIDEQQTLAVIAEVHRQTGIIIDPHTAVGVGAARATYSPGLGRGSSPAGAPMVILSTAHPAKFPDAVAKAIGSAPPVPPRLAEVMTKPEKFDVLPADLSKVMAHVRARTKPRD